MASRLALCLVLPCVLGVFGGTTAVSAQDPVPVVIDSDMIADDWMATLFLLNDPNSRSTPSPSQGPSGRGATSLGCSEIVLLPARPDVSPAPLLRKRIASLPR